MQLYTQANGFFLVGKVSQVRAELARLAQQYRKVQQVILAHRHIT